MFAHYVKLSFRNLSHNKVYSIISILGLAIGLGVCLMIFKYIHYELSFDKFHKNGEHIYRLTREDSRAGEVVDRGVNVPQHLGPLGKDHIPEVKRVTRVHDSFEDLVFMTDDEQQIYQEGEYWYVDQNFLSVFDFSVKYGSYERALSESHHIVITAPVSERYFGNIDPVGKEIVIHGGTLSGRFTISAVLETLPANSHFQFEFLMPMDFLLSHWRMYREGNGWDWYNFATYVELEEHAKLATVSEKFDNLFLAHMGEDLAPNQETVNYQLQPLYDIHLKSHFPDELTYSGSNQNQLYLYGLIAVFVLIIAWVNYVNLTTAQSLRRVKEIGVRKSLGAFKRQIFAQFITESLVHNLLGAVLAIALTYYCLPVFNEITGLKLNLGLMQSSGFWILYILMVSLGSLLAGTYPAFLVIGFQSLGVTSNSKFTYGNRRIRQGLILFQFLISILLVSGTYIVIRQTNFMLQKDLGVDMEKILVINGPRVILKKEQQDQLPIFQSFRNKLVAHHSINEVTGSGKTPGQSFDWVGELRKLGTPRTAFKKGYIVFADSHFADTYGLSFVAGRGYDPDMTIYTDGLIINEAAVKAFDLESAEHAIEEKLIVSIGDTLRILGVVEDFHWQSLKDAHYPMVFALHQFNNAVFSIKVETGNLQETIAHIETTYNQSFPQDPFDYRFLEESFNRQYQADIQFGDLFMAFSVLAIFLACMGLFALVSFSAALRTKEIGVRKVLGARISHLMSLLSREYLMLILFANLLAIPAIWFWGQNWLDSYAFKINMNLDVYLIPGVILLFVSILTVGYKTYITAKANPVDSLRSE